MCLAPCFKGCSDQRYAAEAEAVRAYFASRGASLLRTLEQERNAASAALDFEKAAQLHTRLQKVKAIAQQAAPLVHPLAQLDAVILQSTAPQSPDAGHVAIFCVRAGIIFGPALYSVQGMLHPNEQSGSSSLFAHPTTLAPTLLPESETSATKSSRGTLEARLHDLLEQLESQADPTHMHADRIADHLAILSRWYYRPTAKRTGEIFFRDASGNFPLPKILRGISRVFRGAKNPESLESTAEIPAVASTGIPPSAPSADT